MQYSEIITKYEKFTCTFILPTLFFPLCNYLNYRFDSNKQEYCIFCLTQKKKKKKKRG